MSLEKLKQLELLKSKKAVVVKEYIAYRRQLKASAISKYTSDFKAYLTENKFSVVENGNSVIATFQSFMLTLEVPKAEDSFVQIYTFFKLHESKQKRTYIVEIIPIGETHSKESSNPDETKRMEEEMESLSAYISSNTKPSGYELAYYEESSNNKAKVRANRKKANTFAEIIDSIV